MNQVPLRGNGQESQALTPRARPARPKSGGSELSMVVRDAMDQATEIVRDSLALGTLEAKRAARRVGETVKVVAPRAILLAGAGALLLTGAVLGLIAIFIGLGAFIPSVAARLGLFAALFFVGAGALGVLAARAFGKPSEGPREEAPHEEKPVSSINPVGHVGE